LRLVQTVPIRREPTMEMFAILIAVSPLLAVALAVAIGGSRS
jgi:hypothetical protein